MENEIEKYINSLTQSYEEKIREILLTYDCTSKQNILAFLLQKFLFWNFIHNGYLKFNYEFENSNFLNKLYKYPQKWGDWNYRYSAFTVVLEPGTSIDKIYFRDHITLEPNYIVYMDKTDSLGSGNCMMIDLAVIINRIYDDGKKEVIEQICISFDRHDIYSSEEQLIQEYEPLKSLIQIGWKVLLISHSEMENLDNSSKDKIWKKIQKLMPMEYQRYADDHGVYPESSQDLNSFL